MILMHTHAIGSAHQTLVVKTIKQLSLRVMIHVARRFLEGGPFCNMPLYGIGHC